MKISTEIDSIALHVGEEKAVELVAKTGFDAWDFSMFQMCKKENGVIILTTPFPVSFILFKPEVQTASGFFQSSFSV